MSYTVDGVAVAGDADRGGLALVFCLPWPRCVPRVSGKVNPVTSLSGATFFGHMAWRAYSVPVAQGVGPQVRIPTGAFLEVRGEAVLRPPVAWVVHVFMGMSYVNIESGMLAKVLEC